MPIVIDGWNFIRNDVSSIRDDDGDSLIAARLLIELLSDFQESHKDPIVVVFDSRNEYLDLDYRDTPKLRVIPARNADDRIKELIDSTPRAERPNLRVVSSDNDVYYYARSERAIPVRSEEFWEKIDGKVDKHGLR